LHDTEGAFFFAASAGDVASATAVSVESRASPIVFNFLHPPSARTV